jgi:hypothetical protein
MSKTKTTNPQTLSMQDYLDLEIKRLRDMGFAFPTDLESLLRKRAKGLDKAIMADRTRNAYSTGGDE